MAAARDERVKELEREVQILHEANAKLNSQLEAQYKHMVAAVDTIQRVHITRIHHAVREMAPDTSTYDQFQADFDASAPAADAQLQSIYAASGTQAAAEQAAALRHLEDRARTWAKKFLHKVKAAASAAEARANGGQDGAVIRSVAAPAPRSTRERRSRESREAPIVESAQYSHLNGDAQSYSADGSQQRAAVGSGSGHEWRAPVAEEGSPLQESHGHSQGLSTPRTDEGGAKEKTKKKAFLNRLFSGGRK